MRILSLLAFVALTLNCKHIPGTAGSEEPANTESQSAQGSVEVKTADEPAYNEFPELANMIPQVFREFAESKWPDAPPTLLRQFPLGRDWNMSRSNAGTITGRWAEARLFYRGGASGKCYELGVTVHQEEQGGSWGRPEFSNTMALGEYTCASIESMSAGEPPEL